MKKRFSVLLPVYNRPELVRQAIDSVLGQTFGGYELIVIDDGSTDGTRDLLRSYGARIRMIRQENQGPEVARNLGASQADGEYLAFLDSDDLFLPTALAAYDRLIDIYGLPPVIIGAMGYFETEKPGPALFEAEGPMEVFAYRDFLSKDRGIGMSNSRIVLRKSVFEEAGGLRRSSPSTFHLDDYNLVLRTGTIGPCIVLKNPKTVAYRYHAANSVRNVEAMARGILSLVDAERSGVYPGGRARRFARYACIGGPALQWSRRAFQNHRTGLGLKLSIRSFSMIAASILKKSWYLVWGPRPPVVLKDPVAKGPYE
jgi:glycosyltransferase involved in cell wall biosynthesis